jgi:hypothetical protein
MTATHAISGASGWSSSSSRTTEPALRHRVLATQQVRVGPERRRHERRPRRVATLGIALVRALARLQARVELSQPPQRTPEPVLGLRAAAGHDKRGKCSRASA